MAIAKWIPFGAQQPVTTENTKPEPVPTVSPAGAKKFGLENFGNTCYANSVLQALYFCVPFRELLLQSVDHHVSQTFILPQSNPLPPVTVPAVRPKPQRKHSAAGQTVDAPNTNGSTSHVTPPIPASPPTLLSALRSLFFFISKHPEDKGVVAPRAFIDKLKEVNELFRSTMHQDAHEFLNYLLNKVAEEVEDERRHQQGGTPPAEDCEHNSHPKCLTEIKALLAPPTVTNSIVTLSSRPTTFTTNVTSNSGTSPRDATLVHKLFEGVLTSETRCLTCETVSSRDESFLDLSIDIEQNSSVTACLRQFSASEMLCQKNKFFCDSCCDLQEAEKRMKIKKLPNVLALHLKRFKYQEDVQRYIKLAYRVAFPFELRLFNTVDDTDDADRLYELFAIVVHIGNGPHHGHYVSLVKTLGSWLVFDDDVVDSVKENDIPRYFGDSNSGSAYVLYYQAVDIDLAGLGLRDQVPNPPDPPQSHVTDKHSPSQPVPALPPGLVEERDSPDIGDPLLPVASAPPQALLPTPEISTGKMPLAPLSKINDSNPDDHTLVPTTFPTSGASAIGGLFNSLRRGPSTKVRTSTTAALDSRKSYTESSTRLVVPPTTPANDDQVKMIITSPAPPPLPSSGKEKLPERKASTWFKRKGLKMRPDSGSEHTPPVPDDQGNRHLPLVTSSQTWHRTSGQMVRDDSDRQPPEPVTSNGDVPSLIPPPPQTGLGFSVDNTRDRRNGYDSHSGGSVSSSFASTSAIHASHMHAELPTNSYPAPTAPAMSRKSQTPSPTGMRFPKQQHKPPTHLSHESRSLDLREGEAKPLPPRPPSTSEKPRSKPPVPPVPPLLHLSSASRTVERRMSEGKTSERHDRDDRPGKGKMGAGADEFSTTQPASDRPNTDLGLGSFPGANISTSTTSSAGNGLKRASRKLSLTAPMLGFGRKDKEKQKDKDRDKSIMQPVNSYTAFSMSPRI